MGIGLLTWKTPGGHIVRRHLMTGKASLYFEAHLGKFLVRPSADGTKLAVELDMLDIEEQPSNIKQIVIDGLKSANDNLWDRSSVDTLIKALTNSMADKGEGEYFPNNIEPTSNSAPLKPVVEYAPALALRKRSMRGLEMVLHEIGKQIKGGMPIMHEFLDLCEMKNKNTDSGDKSDEEESGAAVQPQGEIYFPLLANDDQRRIINTLSYDAGVLVQGPPGTGKSHTIANLICHMLATGERVLVTAKTPRALKVLHGMLPEDMKPLCINLLGSGIEERSSLETSVVRMLSKRDRWDAENALNSVQVLEQQIHADRKEKAETDYKFRSIREKETFKHDIAAGAYSGTAAKIAMRLKIEASEYSWFTDKIPHDQTFPLSTEEINTFCTDLTSIDPDHEKDLKLIVPYPDQELPSKDVLHEAFGEERSNLLKVSSNENLLTSNQGKAILNADKQNVIELVNSVNELVVAVESIRKRPNPSGEDPVISTGGCAPGRKTP